jgi:hypothetical protein
MMRASLPPRGFVPLMAVAVIVFILSVARMVVP